MAKSYINFISSTCTSIKITLPGGWCGLFVLTNSGTLILKCDFGLFEYSWSQNSINKLKTFLKDCGKDYLHDKLKGDTRLRGAQPKVFKSFIDYFVQFLKEEKMNLHTMSDSQLIKLFDMVFEEPFTSPTVRAIIRQEETADHQERTVLVSGENQIIINKDGTIDYKCKHISFNNTIPYLMKARIEVALLEMDKELVILIEE